VLSIGTVIKPVTLYGFPAGLQTPLTFPEGMVVAKVILDKIRSKNKILNFILRGFIDWNKYKTKLRKNFSLVCLNTIDFCIKTIVFKVKKMTVFIEFFLHPINFCHRLEMPPIVLVCNKDLPLLDLQSIAQIN
jgi:hypothetical protein